MAGSISMTALEQAMTDYLDLRHSLGHALADVGWLLPSLVAYLDGQSLRTVRVQAALEWAQTSPTGKGRSVGPRRMTAARGFARYLAGVDENTEVPPSGLMPNRQRWRRPFIYTPSDIEAVMRQARTSIASPLRAATYDTLIGLLAATGLRIGEAIKLDRSDIDWDQAVLLIRESKFGKSRLVPLRASSLQALSEYATLRKELQPNPNAASFFVSLTRNRLSYAVVQETFRRLVDSAGVGAGAPSSPRLHDLRHTFAVATLLGWYRSDEDVHARIPSLSTYLGHREPASTYWYLSAALELLALAPPAETPRGRQPGHDLDSSDAAVVLHRPAHPTASGQPAHRRRLPRHHPVAAHVRAQPERPAARPARLGRPRRRSDLRVPEPPRDRTPQQHSHPQRSAHRDPPRCSPTQPSATPSTHWSSSACSRSRRNAWTSGS
jgi:integrase/recombinase XerD